MTPHSTAEKPTAHDPLSHSLWLALEHTIHRYLMSCAHERWNGAEKATRHIELCNHYVATFLGGTLEDAMSDHEAAWKAVHDGTQALTGYLDEVIGFPLDSRPDYDTLAPKFFAEFHRLAVAELATSGTSTAGAAQAPDSKLPAQRPRATVASKILADFGVQRAFQALLNDPGQPACIDVIQAVISELEMHTQTKPVARDVGRTGDMAPATQSHMRVMLDSENDVCVVIWDDSRGQGAMANIEFCTSHGGGKSPKTRAALIAVMQAMEQDNEQAPHGMYPPRSR